MERKHKRWNPGKGACPGIGQISETPAPSRGDIWFADLGDHTGTSVQGGCRPVLVISNDTANIHAETVNVVPLTRHLKKPGLPCHMILDSGDVVDSKQSLDDSIQVPTARYKAAKFPSQPKNDRTSLLLWSSFFVTLLAKKYHYSIMQLPLLHAG